MLLNPRHWPWWGWGLCVVAAGLLYLASAALRYRQTGMHELQTEVARLKAAGYGVFPSDLLAIAPEVDTDRQERVWRLLGVQAHMWEYQRIPIEGMGAHYQSHDVVLRDQETARVLIDSEPARAEWRTLTSEGPMVASILGWIRIDLPHPETATLKQISAVRNSTLLAARPLAQAFAAEARTGTDPRPALQALDSLVAAYDHQGTIIDALVFMLLARIRDDAWLEATLRGCDPQPWIAQVPDVIARTTQSIANERMLSGGVYAQNTLAGKSVTSGIEFSLFESLGAPSSVRESAQNWLSINSIWFLAPHDATFLMQSVATGETLGRTGDGDSGAIEKQLTEQHWFLPISRIYLPNMTDVLKTAVQNDGEARRMRLAAAVVWNWRTTQQIPATLSDLKPEYCLPLNARPWLPSLRYTPITATHFRLDYDPKTPASALIPAGTLASPSTPFTGGYFTDHWSLELDLAELGKCQ